MVGNVNLASNCDYNHGAIIRIYMDINKVLLNEHGDPSFLFQNLSSLDISSQQAKFERKSIVRSFSGE